MEITADIDIDEIAAEVISQIEESCLADDIADRVREDLDISAIADEVVESYSFDNALANAVGDALDNRLADAIDDALGTDIVEDAVSEVLAPLIERIATLEAALASAGATLAVPARRVLHGVEVSATTTGLF